MSSRLPAYLSPRPVRAFTAHLAGSVFVQDVRRRGGVAALGYALILVCALVVGLLTDGVFLDWRGWQEIPSDLPPMDGTDAGLITSPAP